MNPMADLHQVLQASAAKHRMEEMMSYSRQASLREQALAAAAPRPELSRFQFRFMYHVRALLFRLAPRLAARLVL